MIDGFSCDLQASQLSGVAHQTLSELLVAHFVVPRDAPDPEVR